jgi:formate/nitrite transporter FocA (FNT family)
MGLLAMACQRRSLMIAIIIHVILLISFEHVSRNANVIAHELAIGARRSQPYVWMDDPTHFISTFLLHDVSLICNK